MSDEAEFARQCAETGEKIAAVLFGVPKDVAVCVLPGVLAAVSKALGVPRDTIVAMFDSALDDIGDVS